MSQFFFVFSFYCIPHFSPYSPLRSLVPGYVQAIIQNWNKNKTTTTTKTSIVTDLDKRIQLILHHTTWRLLETDSSSHRHSLLNVPQRNRITTLHMRIYYPDKYWKLVSSRAVNATCLPWLSMALNLSPNRTSILFKNTLSLVLSMMRPTKSTEARIV